MLQNFRCRCLSSASFELKESKIFVQCLNPNDTFVHLYIRMWLSLGTILSETSLLWKQLKNRNRKYNCIFLPHYTSNFESVYSVANAEESKMNVSHCHCSLHSFPHSIDAYLSVKWTCAQMNTHHACRFLFFYWFQFRMHNQPTYTGKQLTASTIHKILHQMTYTHT